MNGSEKHIPSGYERIEAGSAEAVVWSPAADLVSEVIGGGRTMHDWAGGRAGSEALHGRGVVHSVPAPLPGPSKCERWAVRHYRRGGAMASLLHDRYLRTGRPRPLGELRASEAARARGVPTPAVVAGAWYATGPFYRADLVTELVGGVVTLASQLFEMDAITRSEREATLEAAGRLVGRLSAAGVRHADLNAMNVLTDRDPRAPSLWILDLDRASVTDGPDLSAAPAMLARLERSLAKLGATANRPLSRAEWSALREGSRAVDRRSVSEGPPHARRRGS